MRNKKLLIIGASGHGKVLADIAMLMGEWTEISFLDDNLSNDNLKEFKVIGDTQSVNKFVNDYEMIIGIGDNTIRKKIALKLERYNAKMATLIHPKSIIARDVKIGKGSVVIAGAIINHSTVIGKSCIINTGATVDHDVIVGDYVHISPGVNLAGTVKIEEESWLGIGSIVNNNISITKRCKIGAGAVIIKDIVEEGTYIGIPARKI